MTHPEVNVLLYSGGIGVPGFIKVGVLLPGMYWIPRFISNWAPCQSFPVSYLLRQPYYFKAPYILTVNFSWCIELPGWAGISPKNFPNYIWAWYRENPILKSLKYVNSPSTNPFVLVHTRPTSSKNNFKN